MSRETFWWWWWCSGDSHALFWRSLPMVVMAFAGGGGGAIPCGGEIRSRKGEMGIRSLLLAWVGSSRSISH